MKKIWILLLVGSFLLSSCHLQQTPTPAVLKPVIYYCFVAEGATPPAGSVVILPNILVLAPVLSTVYQGADAAANLKAGLQAALKDPNTMRGRAPA